MTVGDRFPELLRAAQQGRDPGFAGLYRDLNPRLLRYFAAQAPAEADDLAAETWMAAARGIGNFTGTEEAFRAWLFTIARRRLVQHWRTRARRPQQSGGEAELESIAATDDPEAAGVARVAGREAAAMITAALPQAQAEVILLRVLGELDVADVARILEKSPGAVRVLQHRALQTLSRQLPPGLLTEGPGGAIWRSR